jgi:hypothetical protein
LPPLNRFAARRRAAYRTGRSRQSGRPALFSSQAPASRFQPISHINSGTVISSALNPS